MVIKPWTARRPSVLAQADNQGREKKRRDGRFPSRKSDIHPRGTGRDAESIIHPLPLALIV